LWHCADFFLLTRQHVAALYIILVVVATVWWAALDWRGDAVQLLHVLLRFCVIGAPSGRARQIQNEWPAPSFHSASFTAQNYSWHKIYHRL
jgi:hypothetical protein